MPSALPPDYHLPGPDYLLPGPGNEITWGPHVPAPAQDDIPCLALSEAKDQFLATPSSVGEYLADKSKTAYGHTIDVYRLSKDMSVLSTDELLTLMFVGTNQQCLDARFELVSRIERDCDVDIRKIALSNMAHGSPEPEDDPFHDDPHHWY